MSRNKSNQEQARLELERSRQSLALAKVERAYAHLVASKHERARQRNHIRQAIEAELGFER